MTDAQVKEMIDESYRLDKVLNVVVNATIETVAAARDRKLETLSERRAKAKAVFHKMLIDIAQIDASLLKPEEIALAKKLDRE